MLVRVILLAGAVAVAGIAGQLTGYISDAACGWNNARPGKEAKECAVKCVRAGWEPVFVPDGQAETFKVSDKAKVLPFVGEHVVLTGELKAGLVSVTSIRRSTRGTAAPARPAKARR